jgi:hypothetical protein
MLFSRRRKVVSPVIINFELRFLSETFGIVVDPTAFFADALRAALPRANYRPLRRTRNSP